MAGIDAITYNGTEYTMYQLRQNHPLAMEILEKGNPTDEQIRYINGFLTEDEKDQVNYSDPDYNKNQGSDKIDTKDIKENGENSTGTATTGAVAAGGAAAGAGAAFATAILPPILNKLGVCVSKSKVNGWIALIGAGLAVACTTIALILSGRKTFDPGADVREQYSQSSGDTNSILDAQTQTLDESMAMMNEDMDAYEKENEELSGKMNDKAATIADLNQQIADAEALGDTKLAEDLRKQLKELQEEDFGDEQGSLDEKREGLADFQAWNDESLGVSESGDLVSKYLQFGNKLASPANTSKTLLLIGAGLMAVSAVAAAIPKVWSIAGPLDAFSAAAASIMFGVAGAMMGKASSNMGNNANFESECGQRGDEMSEHVAQLSDMVTQQGQYIEETTTTYDNSDKDQEKIREEGQEAADKLDPTKNGKPTPPPPPKDGNGEGDDKKPGQTPSVIQ